MGIDSFGIYCGLVENQSPSKSCVSPYEISMGGERNLLLFIVQYMYLNWPSRILQFFKLDFEEHIILICTKDSTLVQLVSFFNSLQAD